MTTMADCGVWWRRAQETRKAESKWKKIMQARSQREDTTVSKSNNPPSPSPSTNHNNPQQMLNVGRLLVDLV
jgi:hypothetical protein